MRRAITIVIAGAFVAALAGAALARLGASGVWFYTAAAAIEIPTIVLALRASNAHNQPYGEL